MALRRLLRRFCAIVEGRLCYGCDLGGCSTNQPDIHLKSYREGEGFGMQLVLDGESRLASSNLINISKRPARIDTTHPPLCDAGAMSQVRGIAGLAVTKKRLS